LISAGEVNELEYKKAFYKHNFDYIWHSEIQKLENDHYQIMGGILDLKHSNIINKGPDDTLSKNPLTLS